MSAVLSCGPSRTDPALLSLFLSLITVGAHPYGLDSALQGDEAEAQRLFHAAVSVPGLSDAQRADLERQLRSP